MLHLPRHQRPSAAQPGRPRAGFGWPTDGDSLVAELSFTTKVQVASWQPGATRLAVAAIRPGQDSDSLIVGWPDVTFKIMIEPRDKRSGSRLARALYLDPLHQLRRRWGKRLVLFSLTAG